MEQERGRLKIRVSDSGGNLVPCRMHLKQPDGSCWMPPDVATPRYTETEAPDLILSNHFDRYLHVCHGLGLQSVHLSRGEAEMPAPAGELQVFLSRGPEFVPVMDRIRVEPGKKLQKEYALHRRIDMPGAGWVGGDMHTHFCRWQPSDNHVWARLLQAEGLQAVNNMVYKQAGIVEASQYAMGAPGEHYVGHHVIAGGEEFRDNDLYGHMIAAGIQRVIEPISVGQTLGRRENYPLFSAVLLAPWYPNLGLDRTYAHVEGEFTYKAWIEGIRRGRTFATNGPMIFLTVNGQPPESNLQIPASQDSVLVEARAVCHHGLDCLEIISNGAVVKHVEGKGGQSEIACGERMRLSGSAWFAARVRGRVEPAAYGGVATWNLHAHTSPVYVLLGDQPIRLRADLTAMADYIRMVMEVYRRRGQFATEEQRRELATNCESALAYYDHSLRSPV